MKFKNVKIIELCPLVFVSQDDCKKGELLNETVTEVDIINNWIKEKKIKNVYATCYIDNIVEVQGLEKYQDIIDLFRLCKTTFTQVKLGVYLDDYIQEDGKMINFLDLNSEVEFLKYATCLE